MDWSIYRLTLYDYIEHDLIRLSPSANRAGPGRASLGRAGSGVGADSGSPSVLKNVLHKDDNDSVDPEEDHENP